jgi:hypothetical protein
MISLWPSYRPSWIVTSFYRGEEAHSKKGSNSSLKTCATASSWLVHALITLMHVNWLIHFMFVFPLIIFVLKYNFNLLFFLFLWLGYAHLFLCSLHLLVAYFRARSSLFGGVKNSPLLRSGRILLTDGLMLGLKIIIIRMKFVLYTLSLK